MIHNKYWQAFFALSPIIILFIMMLGYFAVLFSIFSNIPELEQAHNEPPELILQWVGSFMIVIFLVILLSVSSLVFYIVHAVQNPNLKQGHMLLLWILLFIFVGGLGELIYWLVEIVAKRNQNEHID
jgi:heme/copper-type cytochrome/quinol oxidase subunit 2